MIPCSTKVPSNTFDGDFVKYSTQKTITITEIIMKTARKQIFFILIFINSILSKSDK